MVDKSLVRVILTSPLYQGGYSVEKGRTLRNPTLSESYQEVGGQVNEVVGYVSSFERCVDEFEGIRLSHFPGSQDSFSEVVHIEARHVKRIEHVSRDSFSNIA